MTVFKIGSKIVGHETMSTECEYGVSKIHLIINHLKEGLMLFSL